MFVASAGDVSRAGGDSDGWDLELSGGFSTQGLPFGLVWGCPLQHLHAVSLSGLGFLPTWRPQGGQTSFMVAHGSKSTWELLSGGCMAFHDLTLEVT